MIKNVAIVFFAAVFGIGCLPSGSRPARTDPDVVVAYEYVKEVWRTNDVGLFTNKLDDSKCDIDNLYINDSMTLNEFNDYVEAGNDNINAEWSAIRPHVSVIVYNPTLDPYQRRFTTYHELMHFFSWCTREHHDADSNHSDVRVWGYHGVEGQATRACYADHSNISIDEFEFMVENDIGVCPFRP